MTEVNIDFKQLNDEIERRLIAINPEGVAGGWTFDEWDRLSANWRMEPSTISVEQKQQMVLDLVKKWLPEYRVEFSGKMSRRHGYCNWFMKLIKISYPALVQGSIFDLFKTTLHEIAHGEGLGHNWSFYQHYKDIVTSQGLPILTKTTNVGSIKYAHFTIQKPKIFVPTPTVAYNVLATDEKNDKAIPVQCGCGGRYIPHNKNKHFKCKRHLRWESRF